MADLKLLKNNHRCKKDYSPCRDYFSIEILAPLINMLHFAWLASS
jgi:hypothetical protein